MHIIAVSDTRFSEVCYYKWHFNSVKLWVKSILGILQNTVNSYLEQERLFEIYLDFLNANNYQKLYLQFSFKIKTVCINVTLKKKMMIFQKCMRQLSTTYISLCVNRPCDLKTQPAGQGWQN